MELLIIGYAQHGKDTFAEMVQREFGLSFGSSSAIACEKAVWPYLKDEYDSIDDCFNDRSNHRETWHRLIADYNWPDKARLAEQVLKDHDMYVGMRCAEELEASRHLFDLVIWVDSSLRKPPEGPESCSVTPAMADITVNNNGSLWELRRTVSTLKNLLEL
jgi:hypothetical protein